MSLVLQESKPWEREAKSSFRLVRDVTTIFSDKYNGSGTTKTTTSFPDDQDDIVTEGEETVEKTTERTSVLHSEIEVSMGSRRTSTSSIETETVVLNGESNVTTIETYYESESDGLTIRSRHRHVLNGITITDKTSQKEVSTPTKQSFGSEILKVESEEKTGIKFKEIPAAEKFVGLDDQERYALNTEDIRYDLVPTIDRVDLIRDIKGLEREPFDYRIDVKKAISELKEAEAGLHIATVLRYYRVSSVIDPGSRFYKSKASQFSATPLRFDEVWEEISEGGTSGAKLSRKSTSRAVLEAGAEAEEKEVYRIDAYSVPYHVPDGKGGFDLVEHEVEEDVRKEIGFAWSDEDAIYNRIGSYETPALVKKGKYSTSVKLIKALYGYPAITKKKVAMRYVMKIDDEGEVKETQDEGSYADDYTVELDDPGVGAKIRYESSGSYSRSSSTQTSTVETPSGYVDEEIVEERFGVRQATPFPVSLVREVFTDGYAPFGEVDTDVAFDSYDQKVIAEDFGSTPKELWFIAPGFNLNGKIAAGRRKLDLSDRQYETTVERPSLKFKRTVRGVAPKFEPYESEETLARSAEVRQEWVFDDPEAKTHTKGLLRRTIRDSDGITLTQEVEFTLKDRIPKNENTSYVIDAMVDGKWVCTGRQKAELHYGRCGLHVTEINKDGEERSFYIQSEKEGTLEVPPDTSISVRVEYLWIPMGALEGSGILTQPYYSTD